MSPLRFLLVSCVLLGLVGCSAGTREIQTAPPVAAVAPTDTTVAANRALLTVVVETGATVLPEAVHSLRFRVAEVRLKPADSLWTTYPADVNRFEVTNSSGARRTILSTQIPAATYDSLALDLSDVYVEFGPNAGGPLTMPRDRPLTFPVDLTYADADRATVRLTLEPGASLSQSDDCRWFFVPFIEVAVDP
jgi:hypothetical protein